MAGIFTDGMEEVRPGAYFHVDTDDSGIVAGAKDGIVAVLFRADFGPLGIVKELSDSGEVYKVYGNGGRTDTLDFAFLGGARTVLAVRVGTEGTEAKTRIGEMVTINTKYPGERAFSVTIKDSLVDVEKKEVLFYSGNRLVESYSIVKGEAEGSALKAAMQKSVAFTIQVNADGELPILSQQAFTPGTNPTIDVDSYASALEKLASIYCNCICVDTEEISVHFLVKAFLDRGYKNGFFACAALAESASVSLETRIAHAMAFDDEKIIYVLNASGMGVEKEFTGYQVAAVIAGMYASSASNTTLTHKSVSGMVELLEPLTPAEMTNAETKGCLVLSVNQAGKVWIDNAVNTLISLPENKDAGWKKIRRTKTRFELMYRMNTTADSLVGMVDNDKNGRETVIAQLNEVGTAMIQEGKLISCTVTEHPNRAANADYAYFLIDVVDKDSLEHLYLYYNFTFNTSEEG